MKWMLFSGAALVVVLGAETWAMTWTTQSDRKIVGITPEEVKWFTPSYYKDGRQRAQLFGDSSKNGAWVDRVKMPAAMRVPAHTHPQDEFVTVIEGTWYVGQGERFDPALLKGYPAGSFIVIPAGTPHFVATKDGPVIVQLSGTEIFRTDVLEK
jgi:quercetin dioxygenase-like cupin family protein